MTLSSPKGIVVSLVPNLNRWTITFSDYLEPDEWQPEAERLMAKLREAAAPKPEVKPSKPKAKKK